MALIFKAVLAGVIGYLLGSANSSLIVGRFYGVDIRKHGSGNAGTTNALRTLGKKAAVFVLLGDILKGVLACLTGLFLAGETGLMAGGFGAILGHNWPLYFGFKGGKGALTSLAVVFMIDWRIGFIEVGVFILVVAITRYVSLGSIIGAVMLPVLAFIPILNKDTAFTVFSLALALLVIIRHRSNIDRIIKGTESKFGAKKSS